MSENVEKRESLMQHMGALFVAVKQIFFWLFIGLGIGYAASEYILEWIKLPFVQVMGAETKLIFLSPFEKVWVHLRLAFWGGLICVSPLIYYSIFQFVKPALLKGEHKRLNFMMLIVSIVFVVGLYVGQKYSLPLLLDALMSFKSTSDTPFLGLSAYVGAAMGGLFATAVLLEVPVLMFHLSLWGWVESRVWKEGRRMALVLNSVVSAVLSPPDVLSMLVLMIPIQVLYECGILLARMAEWSRHEKN